jgi:16S rRNA processing protein RimM
MSVSDNPERFSEGSVMFARPQKLGMAKMSSGERVRLTVEEVRGTDDFPIVAFEEVETREAAEALRGCVLEVEASQLPSLEAGEFYPFDLVGLTVRVPDGTAVGSVSDVVESPAHALLVVALGDSFASIEAGAREVMVPFVDEAVPTVDLEAGYVEVLARCLFEAEEIAE